METKIKNKIQKIIVITMVVTLILFVVFVQLFLNEKVQLSAFAVKHQINCNKMDNRCYIYKKAYTDKKFEYVGNIVMSNIDILECEKNQRFFDFKNINAANSYYKINFSDPVNKFEIGQFKDLETYNLEKKKLLFKLNNVQGSKNITIFREKE